MLFNVLNLIGCTRNISSMKKKLKRKQKNYRNGKTKAEMNMMLKSRCVQMVSGLFYFLHELVIQGNGIWVFG